VAAHSEGSAAAVAASASKGSLKIQFDVGVPTNEMLDVLFLAEGFLL